MVQLEDYLDGDPILCENCDTEFLVTQTEDYDQDVAFCPFCGSEIDGYIDDEDFEDDED